MPPAAKQDTKDEFSLDEPNKKPDTAENEAADADSSPDEPEVKTESIDLYNANDGIYGREGGPYLDQVEAGQWEAIHAAREGKKPDYDNPRPYPGIQLNPANVQVANYNPTLIAGDDRRVGIESGALKATPQAKGEIPVPADGDDVILPPLKDTPEDHNVSSAVVKSGLR